MAKRKKTESKIPLTETSLYILISLIEPLHGYGILSKIEKMTDGRIQMGAGTLYGALKTLLKDGYIQEVQSTSERRRDYQITEAGRVLITQEIKRHQEIAKNARVALEIEHEE